MTTYSDTARLLDEVQEAHKRLMHARLGLRRSVKEEAAANSAYADAINALLPVEPATLTVKPNVVTVPFVQVPGAGTVQFDPALSSLATTYTSIELANPRPPWQPRHTPLDGNNAG